MMRLLLGTLLVAYLVPSACYAQTILANENFESASGLTLFTPATTGTGATAGFFSGNSAVGSRPASAPQAIEGTSSYGLTGGSSVSTLTLTSGIVNTLGYTSINLHFKVAAFSVNSTNGLDAGDSVRVDVSADGGATYSPILSVRGNGNAYWGFTASGSVSAPYSTSGLTRIQGGSGDQTTGGLANFSVTNLPAVSDLRIRIRLLNDGANERWLLDSLRVVGTSAGPACVAPATAPTALTFPTTTTSSIDGSFSAASGGADGYVVFAAPISTTTAPALTDGTTYSGSNTPPSYTFISSGTGTTFTASGLAPNTAYNFFVLAFNNANCAGGPAYSSSALSGSASTQSVPVCTAPNAAFGIAVTPGSSSASGSFVAPTPAADSFLVFYEFGSTAPPVLTTGTSYNGSNNPSGYTFVSRQPASNTSFSITGLLPSTQYTVYVFAYNGINCSGGPVYSTSASNTFSTTVVVPTTYTWNVASGLWSAASSWAPPRTVPDATDILLFDGATQPAPAATLDFTTSQTISQLKFHNGVSATFLTAADRTLNIGSGASGVDLDLPAGNKLAVQGTASGAGLTVSVLPGNTGLIADTFRAAGNAGVSNQDHRLLAANASGIVFASTGVFYQGAGFDGSPFGNTGTQNTVEFQSGASLVFVAGSNPFGLSAGNSKVSFSPGSNYYLATGGNINPATSGRTYPNLLLVNNTHASGSGSSSFGFNNLTVDIGSSFSFVGSGSSSVSVGGDIVANGPVVLDGGSNTIFLSGAVFSGSDRITIGDSAQAAAFTVNNTDSVVFSNGLTVNTLTLNGGRLISGTDTIMLGTSSTNPGTLLYNGGVIIGAFTRWMEAAANTGVSGLFPMGRSGSGERRLATVEFTSAPVSGGTLTAFLDSTNIGTINQTATTDGNPCPSTFTAQNLAGNYLTIVAGDGLLPGTYDITLEYQNPGAIGNSCEMAIAKRPDGTAAWTIDGAQDFSSLNGSLLTVRQTGIVTGFSDFIIAGSQANPLPLGLTRFDAGAEGRIARLVWTLADADDVRQIAVERSHDGRSFIGIGALQATDAEGTFVDEAPSARRNFYRLRIIDLAGAESVSAVRLVTFVDVTSAGIAIHPNPASDAIRIQGSGTISAILYDAIGRAVRTVSDALAPATISLGGIAGGFYLLHATDGKTTVRERVQVIR